VNVKLQDGDIVSSCYFIVTTKDSTAVITLRKKLCNDWSDLLLSDFLVPKSEHSKLMILKWITVSNCFVYFYQVTDLLIVASRQWSQLHTTVNCLHFNCQLVHT